VFVQNDSSYFDPARLNQGFLISDGAANDMMYTMEKLNHISEENICQLVDAFYTKVRADEALAPIFDRAIQDWGPHLNKMYAFWSSVMLTTGRYKGNPLI